MQKGKTLHIVKIMFFSLLFSLVNTFNFSQNYNKIIYENDTFFVYKPDFNGTVWSTNNQENIKTTSSEGNINSIILTENGQTANSAAKICSDLVSDGYDDWYLPSIQELEVLYINKTQIGSYIYTKYWSSSQYNSTSAYAKDFYYGYKLYEPKSSAYRVKCIRKNPQPIEIKTTSTDFKIYDARVMDCFFCLDNNGKLAADYKNFVKKDYIAPYNYVSLSFFFKANKTNHFKKQFYASEDTIIDSNDIKLFNYSTYDFLSAETVIASKHFEYDWMPPYNKGYFLLQITPIYDVYSKVKSNTIVIPTYYYKYFFNSQSLDFKSLNPRIEISTKKPNDTQKTIDLQISNYTITRQPFGEYCSFYLSKSSHFIKDSSQFLFEKNIFYPSKNSVVYGIDYNEYWNNGMDTLNINEVNVIQNYPVSLSNAQLSKGIYYLHIIPSKIVNKKGFYFTTSSTKILVDQDPQVQLSQDTIEIYTDSKEKILNNFQIKNIGSGNLTWNFQNPYPFLKFQNNLQSGSSSYSYSPNIYYELNVNALPIGDTTFSITINTNDPAKPIINQIFKVHILEDQNNIKLLVDNSQLCKNNTLTFSKVVPNNFNKYSNFEIEWSNENGEFTTYSNTNYISTPTLTLTNYYRDLGKNYRARLIHSQSPYIYSASIPVNKDNRNNEITLKSCNSIFKPSNKGYWKTSGDYYDTISKNNSCDSIILVHAFVNPALCEKDSILTPLAYSKLLSTKSVSSTIDTCLLLNSKIIDSTKILKYNIINSNIALVQWGIWQNGKLITINQNVNFEENDWHIIYLNLICNNNISYLNKITLGDVINLNTLNTENLLNSSIEVSPNPATNTIHIVSSYNFDNFEILNSIGQEVYSYNSNINTEINVNISNLETGIYFIKLNLKNQSIIKKFIKE